VAARTKTKTKTKIALVEPPHDSENAADERRRVGV
jgi:hypothetical protein